MPGFGIYPSGLAGLQRVTGSCCIAGAYGLKGLFVQPNMDKNKIIERSRDHGRRHMPFLCDHACARSDLIEQPTVRV